MTLRKVGTTLQTLRAASLGQLAAELSAPRSDVESALSFWIRRGDVRLCEAGAEPACGTTCTKCPLGRSPKMMETAGRGATGPHVYEWVGE